MLMKQIHSTVYLTTMYIQLLLYSLYMWFVVCGGGVGGVEGEVCVPLPARLAESVYIILYIIGHILMGGG